MKAQTIPSEKDYKPPEDLATSSWLKIEEGKPVTVRLLSHSITFKNHWISSENKNYDCVGIDNGCKWCEVGEKIRHRWAYLALLRDDKAPAVKVFEMGFMIFGDILEFAKDDDLGDPRSYDLKISRKGQKLDTEYTTYPSPKTKDFNEKEVAVVGDLTDIDKATDKLKTYYKIDQKSTSDEVGTDDVPFPDDETARG